MRCLVGAAYRYSDAWACPVLLHLHLLKLLRPSPLERTPGRISDRGAWSIVSNKRWKRIYKGDIFRFYGRYIVCQRLTKLQCMSFLISSQHSTKSTRFCIRQTWGAMMAPQK
ncbi:hypothetical protein AVEN_133065-1 [Araneus ventricosus]|uniref:Uncharacterized protein n=1 Tax=Araneus ventricosus TaxID=182803 RepID=A0A4Y2X856_ARAVE|nr:hypothetical protein AVEN_133065-1 [Araneus ventricosus]